MEWLKKVPTPVAVMLIGGGVLVILAVMGGYVALSLAGLPTDDYTRFVNTLLNAIGLPLLGLTATASISAAKAATKAEEQTNGNMKETMKQAVVEAHRENDLP